MLIILLDIIDLTTNDNIVEDRDNRYANFFKSLPIVSHQYNICLNDAALAILHRHSGDLCQGNTWLTEIFDKYSKDNFLYQPILHLHQSKVPLSKATFEAFQSKFIILNNWIHQLNIKNHQGNRFLLLLSASSFTIHLQDWRDLDFFCKKININLITICKNTQQFIKVSDMEDINFNWSIEKAIQMRKKKSNQYGVILLASE